MSIFSTFGHRAKAVKATARAFARDARLADVYVADTANGPGEADYDLLHAARDLEDAARELRRLHGDIQNRRDEQSKPSRIPVLTFGQTA